MIQIRICFAFLLLSRELLSQIIFQDASFTTQPSTVVTASNQFFYVNNNFSSPFIQTSKNVFKRYKVRMLNWLLFIQDVCFCVNNNRCFSLGGTSTDGSGLIDIRIVNVSFYIFLQFIFSPEISQTASGASTGTTTQITSIASSGITPS